MSPSTTSSLLAHFVRRPRFWLLVLVLVVLLGILGVGWWRRASLPQPGPLPDAIDHLVKKLLVETRERLEGDLGSGSAWGEMGMVLWANEFPDQALEHFAVAEQLDPADLRWPYFQGMILIDRDPPRGLAKLQKTCQLNPHSLAPRLRLAEALFSQGRLAEAEAIVDPLLGEHLDHGPLWLLAGRVSLGQDRLEAARARLQKAARQPLTARTAGLLLSHVLLRQGRTKESAQAQVEANSHPENQGIPDPYWAEANRKKTGKKALLDKIDQLQAQNNLPGTMALAEILTREYPLDANGHFLLGNQRLRFLNQVTDPVQRQELLDDARTALEAAVKLAPTHGGYVLVLALVTFEENTAASYQEALRLAERAAALAPQDALIYRNWGQMHLKKGELEAARAVFDRGLQARPEALDLHQQLAVAYWQQGQFLAAYHHLLQGEIGDGSSLPRLLSLSETLQCW